MKKLLIFSVLALSPLLAAAANYQYVSDKLVITLRTGQGNTYQILKTLETGTRLEVLETTDTGYTRVRTSDGTEGWVRTQYLMDTPTADMQLERVTRQLEQLKEQSDKMRETLSNLQKERAELSAERDQLLKTSTEAQEKLSHLNEVAAKPILLDQENRDLQQKNVALEKELQILSQENQVLKDRSEQEWFIAGAGVLLGGLILGLLIPKIRWKKRSSWT